MVGELSGLKNCCWYTQSLGLSLVLELEAKVSLCSVQSQEDIRGKCYNLLLMVGRV